LYSIGENAKDEDGGGDDIDGSFKYDWLSWFFEDKGFNGETYRKYRGKLTVIADERGIRVRHP
jgi:hypothetical protein